MMTSRIALLFLTCILAGCGTLGGFDIRSFPTSKQNVVAAIDTLYARHPEYRVPNKWKRFDDWQERGYGFLDTRIFYFKADPEEMYYVSFYGDANDAVQANKTYTALSIRAVHDGTTTWKLEEDVSSSSKNR